MSLVTAILALQRRGTVLVCDIDGTLADDAARRHLRPKAEAHCLSDVPLEAIRRYMAPGLLELDTPIQGAVPVLTALATRGLILVTARWESLRAVTMKWLSTHLPTIRPHALLMRRDGDNRPSVEVKLELVRNAAIGGGVWVDDDPLMLAAAQERGFVPLKAPEIFEVTP